MLSDRVSGTPAATALRFAARGSTGPSRGRRTALVSMAALTLMTAVTAGCAALRQNMRGQELSYRGAWYCESAGCSEEQMVRSTSGTRDGTTTINTVSLKPKAAMTFTAASPFDSLEATVRDCKGTSVELPQAAIVPAGTHRVGDQSARESWLVWIDREALAKLELGEGSCAVWKVEARAGWSDGASYSLVAGVEVR